MIYVINESKLSDIFKKKKKDNKQNTKENKQKLLFTENQLSIIRKTMKKIVSYCNSNKEMKEKITDICKKTAGDWGNTWDGKIPKMIYREDTIYEEFARFEYVEDEEYKQIALTLVCRDYMKETLINSLKNEVEIKVVFEGIEDLIILYPIKQLKNPDQE